MTDLRLKYISKSIFIVSIIAFGNSYALGQIINAESARNINSGTECSQMLAATIESVDDSNNQYPKERTFSYKPDSPQNDLQFVISRLNKKSYYKTINLISLSRPVDGKINDDNFQSNVILGLNRPYYHFKNELRVIGNFDLRFENVLWGYANSTTITLGYDLKKTLPHGQSDLKIRIDYVAFKIGFPINPK